MKNMTKKIENIKKSITEEEQKHKEKIDSLKKEMFIQYTNLAKEELLSDNNISDTFKTIISNSDYIEVKEDILQGDDYFDKNSYISFVNIKKEFTINAYLSKEWKEIKENSIIEEFTYCDSPVKFYLKDIGIDIDSKYFEDTYQEDIDFIYFYFYKLITGNLITKNIFYS